jgi:hypothetical protein
MIIKHWVSRPWPDERIFAANPGTDRYVCASANARELLGWFGGYLPALIREGGHIAVYAVAQSAVASSAAGQIVYQQRQGEVTSRTGRVHVDPRSLSPRFHPTKKDRP